MRIVIVGGGFCGTMTAVRLLQSAAAVGSNGSGLEITLLERSRVVGPGVAYGTPSPEHVLNVPAGRMSPFPEDEEAFLRFARDRDPGVGPDSFLPRRLYGEFLEQLLARAAAEAPSGTSLACLRDSAVDVAPVTARGGASVRLESGREVDADHVVLALGNLAADAVPFVTDLARDPGIVRDPWAPGALERTAADGPVLLVGTGLTMIDVALELHARGSAGPLHAVSRHGLLPQEHRSSTLHGALDAPALALREPALTARRMLQALRGQAALARGLGGDWRDALASIRAATPQLWSALGVSERARFLRHLRTYWDIHRHRVAPGPAATVRRLRDAAQLRVHAARVHEIRRVGDDLEVSLAPRDGAPSFPLRVRRVVRCTGPASEPGQSHDPLVAKLRSRGLLCSDELGIGVQATSDGALVDARGRVLPTLSYVGPWLRAQAWEATAVPELRLHATRLAARLMGAVPAAR